LLAGGIHFAKSKKKGEMPSRYSEGISPDKQLVPRNFTGQFGQWSNRECSIDFQSSLISIVSPGLTSICRSIDPSWNDLGTELKLAGDLHHRLHGM
jgi:hypothetical protein